jgi:hypothetical protein
VTGTVSAALVPAAHEALRGAALVLVERDRLAVDAHAVEQRHAVVAVLAEHPGVDRAGANAELVADRGSQPQPVVGGVAEHAPAVERAVALDDRAEDVDRVGDTITTPGQPLGSAAAISPTIAVLSRR